MNIYSIILLFCCLASLTYGAVARDTKDKRFFMGVSAVCLYGACVMAV